MHNNKEERIFSVSEYIGYLNKGLREFAARIIGEVSEVKVGPSGHVYFSLKDEGDGGIINCIIWRSRYHLYGIELKEGLKIIAAGYPEIYPPSGRISFLAEVIEHVGEGRLKKEYEMLKKKLSQEGLFSEERKRPLPIYPQKIGLITSLKGAVIADFSNNLGKFGFKVKIIDSRVEGQAAVSDLLSSIKTFKKEDIEVLVIMRGGGSLESMLAFNNELLVREVVDFPVPVIAAIGHHKDAPLVALAADLAVSTPSIAATALSESWKRTALFLERYERNIIGDYENGLNNVKINLRNLIPDLFLGFKSILSRVIKQLEYIEKAINSHNPERQLCLGYSIASRGGRIIRRIKDVEMGKDIDLRVTDGIIISKVKNTRLV
ncbi:MAG: exodeoxyribonuclease VII large subunit [Candidatus Nealsonbacteria bacterium]|nr:exodeoxyribonuclease VII large subunit [Candidatus Nealsonbacteria bacterium]